MTVALHAARNADVWDAGAEAVVFLGVGRPFERIGVPVVLLRPGETLVAVELVALCPEDARIVSGAEPTTGPIVLGHEQVGRVVAVSPIRRPRDVHGKRLAVGDRVVWAAGVGRHRYGHDRVERGWELSGGCATHVQLLARTPVVRVAEDAPALEVAVASCGVFTAAELLERVEAALCGTSLPVEEFALAETEHAVAALTDSVRVVVRPSSPG